MVEGIANAGPPAKPKRMGFNRHRPLNLIRAGLDALGNERVLPARAGLKIVMGPNGYFLSGKGFDDTGLFVELHDEDELWGALDIYEGSSGASVEIEGDAGLDLNFRIPNGPFPELRKMIEEEIRYRSPFSADEAKWFWSAEESEDGDWSVRAVVVPRVLTRPLAEALEGADLAAVRVARVTNDQTLETGGDWLTEEPADSTAPKSIAVPTLTKVVVAAAALFAMSAAAQIYFQKSEIAALRTEAAASSAALSEVAQAKAAERAFDVTRLRSYQTLGMVGTLTQTLPDGYWLDQMTIAENEVTITGYGPSAAEVSRLLSALPELGEVRYASPVTRDNTQNIERFRIAATLLEVGQ